MIAHVLAVWAGVALSGIIGGVAVAAIASWAFRGRIAGWLRR